MRDKDIKELFDSAADNFTYSDITPEEIKNLVDGRINRNIGSYRSPFRSGSNSHRLKLSNKHRQTRFSFGK